MPEGLKRLFERKVFGIPIIIIAVVAVGILVVVAWKMKPLSDDEAAAAEGEEVEGDGTVMPDGEQFPSLAGGTVTTTTIPGQDTTTTTTIDSNDLWLKRAVEWLQTQPNGALPSKSQPALQDYLEGENLSYEQSRIVDMAVKQFGVPPEPFSRGTTAPKPASRQGTPGKGFTHTVMGSSDNTFTQLAALYGHPGNQYVDQLQAANTRWGHSGPFPVGSRITIHAFRVPKYYTSTTTTNTAGEIARKHGISVGDLIELNDTIRFPVKKGTRVRVA